jgi:hypothetical protein
MGGVVGSILDGKNVREIVSANNIFSSINSWMILVKAA